MAALDADTRAAVAGFSSRNGIFKVLTFTGLLGIFFGILIVLFVLTFLTSENQSVSPDTLYLMVGIIVLGLIFIFLAYFAWIANVGRYIYSRLKLNKGMFKGAEVNPFEEVNPFNNGVDVPTINPFKTPPVPRLTIIPRLSEVAD